MATRRKSNRRNPTATPYDPDILENWTRSQLVERIAACGIKISGNLPLAELRRIYKDNSDSSGPLTTSAPARVVESDDSARQPRRASASTSAPARVNVSVSQGTTSAQARTEPDVIGMSTVGMNNSVNSDLVNIVTTLQMSVAGLQQTVTNLLTQPPVSTSSSTVTSGELSGHTLESCSSSTSAGISAEDLPTIDVVSPTLKRSIVEGKDVNLASLLIPDFEMPQDRTVLTGGLEFRVKTQTDPRLNKSLTISEFITSFGKYKRVMCNRYPNRRLELDAYEANIVEIHNVFGSKFYEYHKLFSAKAAAAISNLNIKVDWSKRDRDLFLMVVGGSRSNTCASCHSVTHTADFCPSAQTNTYKEFKGSGTPAKDKYGRQIAYLQGEPICNNYNTTPGCNRRNCLRIHACSLCFALNHNSTTCTNKAGRGKGYDQIPQKRV